MLKPQKFPRGFTLIELAIGIAIVAILMVLAVPNFSLWIRNIGIRTATESILSGLQLARAEALKGNTLTRFQLTSTLDDDCALSASGPHWIVSRGAAEGKCAAAASDTEGPRILRSYDGAQANGDKAVIRANAPLLTFNGLGRLTVPSGGTAIDVYGSRGSGDCASGTDNAKARCLRIQVSPGGDIRMCDPALSANDSQACL